MEVTRPVLFEVNAGNSDGRTMRGAPNTIARRNSGCDGAYFFKREIIMGCKNGGKKPVKK